MKKLAVVTLLAAACGDNHNVTPDASVDSTADVDAAPFTPPTAHSFSLSPQGHDQIMAVAPGPNGSFYAAGYSMADTQTATAKKIVVFKLLPTGMPDNNFGTMGVLDTQVTFRGGSDEIDLHVYADGGALVSATVAAALTNVVDASDTDIALIKVTPAGALDNNFGGGDGVVVQSFNTSILNMAQTPAPVGRDVARGLDVSSTGEIYVHGAQRGEGLQMNSVLARLDTDFVIARFTAAGALDMNWGGGDGKHVQDIYYQGAHSSAVARGLAVLDTGAVIAGGYASSGIAGGAQPVLIRLKSDGTPDGDFGTNGLFHDVVLGYQAEVYNFAIHGNYIVTGGYGRENEMPNINNFISIRVDLATGARDMTFGTNGRAFFDPTPEDSEAGSNCRGALALPNGKTLLIGSSSRSQNDMANPHPEAQDAVFAVLDSNGQLDTSYGTGVVTYQLGTDGADQFWGAAVNGNYVMIAGWKGTVGTASATNNDDSYGLLFQAK